MDTAGRIAGMSKVAVRAAKEVVNKSQDLPLKEGLDFERKVFQGLFASKDQKIGMLWVLRPVYCHSNGVITDLCLQECQLSWRRGSRNGLMSRINHHVCPDANFQWFAVSRISFAEFRSSFFTTSESQKPLPAQPVICMQI